MGPRQQRRLLALLEKRYGPELAREFQRSIRALRAGVDTAAMRAALATGDIAAAVAAANLTGPVLRSLEVKIAEIFEKAGQAFMSAFPKRLRRPDATMVVFRFDVKHPEAERWLARKSSAFVTRLLEEERESLRNYLVDGLRRGVNPRQLTQEIAGKIVGGRRQGGIMGLSGPQTQYVQNARLELRSGDRAALKNYLRRTKRDRRFDGQVKRALEAGKALPQAQVDKIVGRYSDRLLAHRAEVVSRTETLNALRAGQYEAFNQGAEELGGTDQDLEREWDATGDSRTRPTHSEADGQKVKGREAPFTVGGHMMLYPGDSSLGAPAEEVILCRCIVTYRLDFAKVLKHGTTNVLRTGRRQRTQLRASSGVRRQVFSSGSIRARANSSGQRRKIAG